MGTLPWLGNRSSVLAMGLYLSDEKGGLLQVQEVRRASSWGAIETSNAFLATRISSFPRRFHLAELPEHWAVSCA